MTVRRPRRRIKVHTGGNLGWLLCWGVVFADIGTSIYYVPGILYDPYRGQAAIFVILVMLVFILLTVKYAEVAWRYPEGGGVVTVASRALHPFLGLLGGLFILVDYYLTAALSALSGVYYLGILYPPLANATAALLATITFLVLLGVLNFIGIRESARFSTLIAVAAGLCQLLTVLLVVIHLGPAGTLHSFSALGRGGPRLAPTSIVVGYAAAFLAFSGLESITQISPAMRAPRNRTASLAMTAVVFTMAATSPLLTFWSTTVLSGNPNTNQFISLLATQVSGPQIGAVVALTGAMLLVFASNTAIIGSYHVFIALARMGFLPRIIERRNHWRHTPHVAILLSISLPIVLVAKSNGSANFLGDLYAFGLLGAFVLTCIGLDVVRYREGWPHQGPKRRMVFWLGVLTTICVAVAWCTNLVAKPAATQFGGALTILGVVVGFLTYRRSQQRRPTVFPLPFEPDRAAASIEAALRGRPAGLLVLLPHDPELAEAVLAEARGASEGREAVFLYRGEPLSPERPELMAVTDPYLRDYGAQDSFARAESRTRRDIPDRRYVYVPGSLRREVIADIWRHMTPSETLVAETEQDVLPPVALDRVRRRIVDGVPVLRLVTGKLRLAASGA